MLHMLQEVMKSIFNVCVLKSINVVGDVGQQSSWVIFSTCGFPLGFASCCPMIFLRLELAASNLLVTARFSWPPCRQLELWQCCLPGGQADSEHRQRVVSACGGRPGELLACRRAELENHICGLPAWRQACLRERLWRLKHCPCAMLTLFWMRSCGARDAQQISIADWFSWTRSLRSIANHLTVF